MVRIPLNEGTPLQNKYYNQKTEMNPKVQDCKHHGSRKNKAVCYHVTYKLRGKIHSLIA